MAKIRRKKKHNVIASAGMKNTAPAIKERKEAALRAARAQGVVDVVEASANNGVSLETLELAIKLTKKHGPALCDEFEEIRNSQK